MAGRRIATSKRLSWVPAAAGMGGMCCALLAGTALGQADPFGALYQGPLPAMGAGPAPSAGPVSPSARSGSQGLSNAVGASYSSHQMTGQVMTLAQLGFLPRTVAPLDPPVKAFHTDYLVKRPRIAIPEYAIAFVTGYQSAASAAGAGSDITPRSAKVATTLIGVSDALKQQLANEAYADLVSRLKAAGIEVVPMNEVQAAPHLQSIERPQRPVGGDVARSWTMFSAEGAPLVRGFALDGGLATSSALLALGPVSKELDAVVVLPQLTIDHLDIANSGRSNYGGQATVDANLNFHIGRAWFQFIWGNERGGAMPGSINLDRKASPELFGILYPLEDRSDSVALHNAFADAGMGSIYRQSLVYAAEVDPQRYAALTRAAFQGANQALVDQIVRAKAH